MKNSSTHFSTKRALKAKIMSDLADSMCFHSYALYLTNAKCSVATWVKFYTEQHCAQSQFGKTRFTELAEIELEDLVDSIAKAAKTVTDSFPDADIKKWLDKFHGKLMMKLSLDLGEIQKVVGELKDLKNFTEHIFKKLSALNINQFESLNDMDKWDEKPHEILLRSLIGCCEQCPFCKEQCELTNSNHSGRKHHVYLHRSECLGGWRWSRSQKMALETCNAMVASQLTFEYFQDGSRKSHPCKNYQEVYPSWYIDPNNSLEVTSYWKWFLANYTTNVAQLYNMKPAKIPSRWMSLTLDTVKEDLKKLYKL